MHSLRTSSNSTARYAHLLTADPRLCSTKLCTRSRAECLTCHTLSLACNAHLFTIQVAGAHLKIHLLEQSARILRPSATA